MGNCEFVKDKLFNSFKNPDPQQLPSPRSCVSRKESHSRRVIVGVIVGARQQLPSTRSCVSRKDSHSRRVIVGVIVGERQRSPPQRPCAPSKGSHSQRACARALGGARQQLQSPRPCASRKESHPRTAWVGALGGARQQSQSPRRCASCAEPRPLEARIRVSVGKASPFQCQWRATPFETKLRWFSCARAPPMLKQVAKTTCSKQKILFNIGGRRRPSNPGPRGRHDFKLVLKGLDGYGLLSRQRLTEELAGDPPSDRHVRLRPWFVFRSASGPGNRSGG